jgi:tetratricopeptide (TPR) repeat protein
VPRPFPPVAVATLALALLATAPAGAQEPPPPEPKLAIVTDPRTVAQVAQREFERTRRRLLDPYQGRTFSGRDCPEPVGVRWCYWYNEDQSIPPERAEVGAARAKLLATLDSLGAQHAADNWIVGQRVRYHIEAGHRDEALRIAEACSSYGWWCDALRGFALHELRRYTDAEAAFEQVLAALGPRERCRWRDLTLYLDDDTRRQYIRTECGTAARDAFESRVWWYSRIRYGLAGNDSRTEHFARLTYAELMRETETPDGTDFDEAHRELMVRFGWARGFARGPGSPMWQGPRRPDEVDVIGAEPTPAYRLIPPAHVITSPAASDSIDWAVQLPPVIARYAPPYAKRLLMLEHQQGLFRRGDTALMVLAYDVSKVPGLDSARLDASLVLTPGTTPRWSGITINGAPAKGQLTVRAPWGPLLMSAEIAAESASTLVRARYGIRPPFAIGARVSLSDLLFYVPYDGRPTSVEEVLPHALATQKVRASEKLGVYWEAYNTNPDGERMTVSLVVAPEVEEETRGSRIGRALRLSRNTTPVSVTVEDLSARGSRMTVRSLELDISTLRAGAYLVQLEIDVAGQYTIRADRRLVVTGP